MTTRGPTPEDLETIAAFIDQRLTPEERTAFLQRLDREEALYEVFVETVRCREEALAAEAKDRDGEKNEDDPEKGTLPVAGRGWRTWALPAVAGLALAAAAAVLLYQGPTYPAALVAHGDLDLETDWFEQPWPNGRSLSPRSDEHELAFRVCVRVVDLDVALRVGRRDDAAVLTRRIDALLAQVSSSYPLRETYDALRQKLAQGVTDRQLLAQARAANRAVDDRLEPMKTACELGRWAEVGRLASRSGNERLLRGRAFGRQLDRLLRDELELEARAGLDSVARLLAADGSALDLATLERAFLALIARGWRARPGPTSTAWAAPGGAGAGSSISCCAPTSLRPSRRWCR